VSACLASMTINPASRWSSEASTLPPCDVQLVLLQTSWRPTHKCKKQALAVMRVSAQSVEWRRVPCTGQRLLEFVFISLHGPHLRKKLVSRLQYACKSLDTAAPWSGTMKDRNTKLQKPPSKRPKG
jgi:hypothetical protein